MVSKLAMEESLDRQVEETVLLLKVVDVAVEISNHGLCTCLHSLQHSIVSRAIRFKVTAYTPKCKIDVSAIVACGFVEPLRIKVFIS